MIKIENLTKVGYDGKLEIMNFKFVFDNTSYLPTKVYSIGQNNYIIANGSTATNVITGATYTYNNYNWIKQQGSGEPVSPKFSEITNNGTYSIMNNEAKGFNTISVNTSGGGPSPTTGDKDVKFYDYDGTLVNAYTKDEFLALSKLPANPTHEGLTAQGWNWTLSDAKDYVTDYEKLNIGQIYVNDTPNGDTLLHIRLTDGRLAPYLGLTGNESGTTVSINWGDGSESQTVTLNNVSKYTLHEYATEGEYIISVSVISGSIRFTGNSTYGAYIFTKFSNPSENVDSVYKNALIKVEFGDNVILDSYALSKCESLLFVTLSNSITAINDLAFEHCGSLKLVTIPNSVMSIGESAFAYAPLTTLIIPKQMTTIKQKAFYGCYSLSLVILSNSVTTINEHTFYQCYSLKSIIIPNSVTTIKENSFNCCYSLQFIIIPNGVTSIDSTVFRECYFLTSVTIPSSVTSIGDYTFYNCYSLTSVTIPSGVTTVASYILYQCNSLASVIIPFGVTSIEQAAFQYCRSLTSITLPSTITRIEPQVFQYCYGLGFIKFSSTTPPTVANSNAWNGIPKDCKIYVPSGSLSAYTSASNYPSSSTYTYIEY